MPTRPDMPDRPDMLARPGQLWRKTFTFTFILDFLETRTRQDKTLVPWTVDGSLVFVATAYRLGERRGRVPVGWVTRKEIFLFWESCFDGDG